MASNDFIVLGCGTSLGTPNLRCYLRDRRKSCACVKGMVGDPANNKNYRLNPSILIRAQKDGQSRNILIDACKTFKQSVVRWFPKHGVDHLDAVLFTHEHSDAILGIDDLREMPSSGDVLPLYMSERCYEKVHSAFNYLMYRPPEYVEGVQKSVELELSEAPKTFTASVQCHIIAKPELAEAKMPRQFDIEGVQVTAFPVFHGRRVNLSMGFCFGRGEAKFVYISDMNDLPEETAKYLRTLKIKVLMVDGIHPTNTLYSHQSVVDAIHMAKQLEAEKVYLTGLGHEIVYEKMSATLAEEKRKSGLDVELSYDGMVVSLDGIDL